MSAFPSYEPSTLDEALDDVGVDTELRRILAAGPLPMDHYVMRVNEQTTLIRVEAYVPGMTEDVPAGGMTWTIYDEQPDALVWSSISLAQDLQGLGFFDYLTYSVGDFMREGFGVSRVLVPLAATAVTPQVELVLRQIGFELEEEADQWAGSLAEGSRHMKYIRWRQGRAEMPEWRG